jgi:hypothetical protein
LLGVCDRTPPRLVLNRSSGELTALDLRQPFSAANGGFIPDAHGEPVPFRLTRSLCCLVSPQGILGPFIAAMVAHIRVQFCNSEPLHALLSLLAWGDIHDLLTAREAAAAGAAAAAAAAAAEGGLVPARDVPSLATDADGGGPPPELLAAIAAATGCAADGLSGGYCAQVCALAVMPHADVFATGSGDGFVRLWQLVASGGGAAAEAAAFRAIKPLGAIPIKGIVNGLAFSRDGRTLVAAVATEHRLGRWWRYSGAQNGLAVLSLPLPRGK